MTNHVFLLIHGTWGRGLFPSDKAIASWCAEGSAMRKMLERVDPEARIEVFPWSGANTIVARFLAAHALQETLDGLRSESPDCKVHLISHSHGGNVVMYCLRDVAQQRQIGSAIFLSTPFVHAHIRDGGVKVAGIARSFTVLGLLLACVAVACAGLTVEDIGRPKPWWYHAAYVSVWLFGLLIVVSRKWDPGWMGFERRTEIAAFLRQPAELGVPTKIIRAASDEASNALGATALLGKLGVGPFAWAAQRLWSRVGRLVEAIEKASAVGLLVAYLVATVLGAALGDVGVFATLFAAGVAASIGVTLLILLFIASALSRAVGAPLALSLWGIDVTGETTPPGSWPVTHVAGGARGDLQHATHSDPESLHEAHVFLEAVVKGQRGGGAGAGTTS